MQRRLTFFLALYSCRRCKTLCPLREVYVQSVVGSCNTFADCPKAINSSKLPCCFALTEMADASCDSVSYGCVCEKKICCCNPDGQVM